MASTTNKPLDQESLLATIRKHVGKADGRRIGFRQFLTATGLRQRDIFKLYPSWNELLRAANVPFDLRGERIDRGKLLADWGRVARNLQRIPNCNNYKLDGKHSTSTLARCFGSWSKVGPAFREFAAGNSEWADVMGFFENLEEGISRKRRRWVTTRQQRLTQGSFGAPIPLTELRNAPANENGVIYLFGVLASRLGFSVEAIRPAFPDCIAKRRIGPDEWQNVRIEFEYESRNFHHHRHASENCDLIVCWTHNWPDCPANLEVIALSEVIKKVEK